MLEIPALLDNPSFYDAKLDYKWNDELFFEWDDVENRKLLELFLKLNHKASVGLAATFAEWIYWRLHKKGDMSLLLHSIEPIWAGLIDKRYIVDWDFEADYEDIGTVNGVKLLVIESLQETRRYYLNGRYYIVTQLESQAMLARHVTSDKTLFDDWLTDCLKRAISSFPVEYDRSNPSEYGKDGKPYYDSSDEPPIPREFFFTPDFDFGKADIPQLLNNFLSKLSWKENNLLASPEKMREEGFEGTPYQYLKG